MNIHLLYVGIDAAAITVLALIVIRFVYLAPRNKSSWILVLIAFDTTCYLLSARQDYAFYIPDILRIDLGSFYVVANLARNSTSALMVFLCHFIFRDGHPIPRWLFALFILQLFLEEPLAWLVADDWASTSPSLALLFDDIVPSGLQIFMIAYAFYLMLSEKSADLVQARRQVRVVLLVVIGLRSILSLLLERIAFQFDIFTSDPRYEIHVGLVAIGLLSSIAILFLLMRSDIVQFIDPIINVRDPQPRPIDMTAADVKRVEAALGQDKVYRQNGLSVHDLAKHLNLPEYRLRKLIHDHLGFRNFNTLLHRYRVDEVAQALADPNQNGTPVLTLALSAGYQSITPFNRAFRELKDMTPTQFRSYTQNSRIDT